MAGWLRQSTAADIMLGPFVDSTDGFTPETALTLTQPDIRLSKNGAAFAQKSAAQTLAHGENGWYPCNLSTTDTGTLGLLTVAVYEVGALPVWREFLVVTAAVWDSHMAAGTLWATPADVLTQTNAALDTAVSQPGSGAPAANPSIRTAVAMLFKAWRNKTTQSASQYSLYNDDTVVIDHKATFSDDGTTATRGEVASGP